MRALRGLRAAYHLLYVVILNIIARIDEFVNWVDQVRRIAQRGYRLKPTQRSDSFDESQNTGA
mgnify:FL=1